MLDFIGVGLGPFNLSLAALIEGLPASREQKNLSYMFFEQKDNFSWHDGMLLPNTTLQVPFMADLVTMADPTSRFSFLNYLRQHDRLFQFYFLEKLHIPRLEYNHYCQWVSQQLPHLSFNSRVLDITPLELGFEVLIEQGGIIHRFQARNIVLGTGTVPVVPECLQTFMQTHPEHCFHSASYAQRMPQHESGDVLVLGSGQSAAEVFTSLFDQQCDAQGQAKFALHWLTRSAGFFPMEYSALGLEHFTPAYMQYFYQLPQTLKDQLIAKQGLFYKGISFATIADIYNKFYHRSIAGQSLQVQVSGLSELYDVRMEGERVQLRFRHLQQQRDFEISTDYVIAATGYQHRLPDCLNGLQSVLTVDEQQRLSISEDYRVMHHGATGQIFAQNAELHTHGIGTPDLGMGAHRAATIANQLLGYQAFTLGQQQTFQRFGVPDLCPV